MFQTDSANGASGILQTKQPVEKVCNMAAVGYSFKCHAIYLTGKFKQNGMPGCLQVSDETRDLVLCNKRMCD